MTLAVGRLQVDQNQFRAKLGKQFRRGASDSRSRPRDHRDFSGQTLQAPLEGIFQFQRELVAAIEPGVFMLAGYAGSAVRAE